MNDEAGAGRAPTKVTKTDAEWRAELSPAQYVVTRANGTEPPFSHPYHALKTPGTYACVCCKAPLFRSDDKFDSRTGWPSVVRPITDDAVQEHVGRGCFLRRTEVRCATCDAPLGHVFADGPQPTGLRYCINGNALRLRPDTSAGDANAG